MQGDEDATLKVPYSLSFKDAAADTADGLAVMEQLLY